MKNVTVGDMLDSLSNFDRDMPLEIVVNQYNSRYPVAYCKPQANHRTLMPDTFAVCLNGVDVRIDITLPYSATEFMYTSKRKIK